MRRPPPKRGTPLPPRSYPHVSPGPNQNYVSAYRALWETTFGPIPEGLQVDHECHNEAFARGECVGGNDCPHRLCMNPAHFRLRTPRENTLRGNSLSARNARKTHCKNGHEFTDENTYVDCRGARCCRPCHAKRERERKAARA